MDTFETKIPASEKDSSMMRKSAFESKSLDEKKEKDKDKKKVNVLFEADDPKPERPVEIFEKEDSAPQSFQELLGVADKKENEPETDDIETEDDDSVEAVESESRDSELDEEEEPHVAKEITKVEKEELNQEEAAVEQDSPDAAGIIAARSLVEKFDDKIEEMPLDQALESAVAEVKAEINQDLEQNDEASDDDLELPADKPVELETENMEEPELSEDEEPEVAGTPPPPPPTDIPHGGEPAPEPEPDPATTPGNNTTPPRGPVPPWLNPNIVGPGQNNPNVAAGTEISAAERAHQRAGDVLIGGILGYLLGRRRGRIKTERRLEPVKEKLEQEVVALREKIQDKEREVRELARSAAEEKKNVKQRQELIERLQPKKTDKAVKAEADNTSLEEAMPLQAVESSHAETLHKRPETIGRMAVTIDTPTARETLKETPREALQARRVEHMAATELLAVAERIVVEGASVREMYEAGRLDPEGLRHVVAEYLRGGNVEKMVAREALGEERQHERQPERQPGPFVSTTKSSGMAQPSGAATSPAAEPNDVRQRLAEFSNPDNSHAFNVITSNKPKQQNSPKILITIVSLAAVVMVIAAYVISAG